jgi:flagellar hook-associated protein 1 FlgK
MSGISDALHSTANRLLGLERSLAVIEGNVNNASTPGYARQDLGMGSDVTSLEFESKSSRDQAAEVAVRRQNSQLGHFDQLASALAMVESSFGAGGDSGIPKSISALFATFSALSINPNDLGARQQVLDRAAQLARTFNGAAASLATYIADGRRQISATVDGINHLAGLVRDYNISQRNNSGGVNSPSVDASLNATLEELSELADVQAVRQSDGSITLLLNGQSTLLVGENLYEIQADTTSSPTVAIRDASGTDITDRISGGRLGGGLKAVNQLLPGYLTGLDQLAQGIPNQVNGQLAAGVDAFGNPGAPLFSFSIPGAAATLSFTGIGPGELAAAQAGAAAGNGNALALAGLETGAVLNGLTFARFYGSLAAGVGRDVADSRDNLDFQRQLVAQARAHRADTSGVSLDQEAIRLVEYQRAYEATAKLVAILDQMSQETIDMLR